MKYWKDGDIEYPKVEIIIGKFGAFVGDGAVAWFQGNLE